MPRRAIRAIALSACVCWAAPASASECRPANGTTPCIDANSLWPATGSARFLTLPEPVALPRGRVGLALLAQVLFRPLSADVPSPAETGREVRLVEGTVEQALLLSVGLGENLELGLSLPMILRQTGTGKGRLGPWLEACQTVSTLPAWVLTW